MAGRGVVVEPDTEVGAVVVAQAVPVVVALLVVAGSSFTESTRLFTLLHLTSHYKQTVHLFREAQL